MTSALPARGPTRLIDMIFPGDTNHHGTLFGGVALAHMDKVAFLAASRHGRAPFVTASSERIDFAAPALKGELIEATGKIARVGTTSIAVEVELIAEVLLTGERRLCTRGLFTLVAVKGGATALPLPALPPETDTDLEVPGEDLRYVDMVFPSRTNHYGTLFGGDTLSMLGKAAFLASTRHGRAVMVMAAADDIQFNSPVNEGEMVELIAKVTATGRSSLTVAVQLWGEGLLTGDRRRAASANFTMVSIGPEGRPEALASCDQAGDGA